MTDTRVVIIGYYIRANGRVSHHASLNRDRAFCGLGAKGLSFTTPYWTPTAALALLSKRVRGHICKRCRAGVIRQLDAVSRLGHLVT